MDRALSVSRAMETPRSASALGLLQAMRLRASMGPGPRRVCLASSTIWANEVLAGTSAAQATSQSQLSPPCCVLRVPCGGIKTWVVSLCSPSKPGWRIRSFLFLGIPRHQRDTEPQQSTAPAHHGISCPLRVERPLTILGRRGAFARHTPRVVLNASPQSAWRTLALAASQPLTL